MVVLLMVQKSGDHHLGCKESCEFNGMNHQPQLVSQIVSHQGVCVSGGLGGPMFFYGGFVRKDLLKVLAYLLLPSLRHLFCLENDSLTMSIVGRFNQGGAPTIVISKWSDIGGPYLSLVFPGRPPWVWCRNFDDWNMELFQVMLTSEILLAMKKRSQPCCLGSHG